MPHFLATQSLAAADSLGRALADHARSPFAGDRRQRCSLLYRRRRVRHFVHNARSPRCTFSLHAHTPLSPLTREPHPHSRHSAAPPSRAGRSPCVGACVFACVPSLPDRCKQRPRTAAAATQQRCAALSTGLLMTSSRLTYYGSRGRALGRRRRWPAASGGGGQRWRGAESGRGGARAYTCGGESGSAQSQSWAAARSAGVMAPSFTNLN